MKGKKGALELSVNTIIIIVIGVTLLSLGLVFVRGIFTQTMDLSDKAFADANSELDSLSGSSKKELTASPETVRLEAGQTSGFLVQITNLEEGATWSGLIGTLTSFGTGVTCEFKDGKTTTIVRDLIPGAWDRLNVYVKSQKGILGTKSCTFTLGKVPLGNLFDPEVEVAVVLS